ncbi:MAG: putative membrane protein [Rhodobacteraceae bacterium HLUCCA12]|nr:MAG: putative membrane protein [Rhodobacteraceae bacterium HLUCCA12]
MGPGGYGRRMIRTLYDWTLSLAAHPRALWALAFVAFIEASVFPIPPDVLMVAMILAAPQRAFVIAAVATAASVLGGLLGYAIGAFAFDTIGRPVLEALGKGDAVAAFNTRFNSAGFWSVLVAGVTPFPFKVITIMSGWTAMPLGVFIGTAIIARALRFFFVAALLWRFGTPIRDFIDRWLGLLSILFVIVLFLGFYSVRYL